MIEAGLISALGFIIVLARFNLRRIAGYALLFDVVITGTLVWMFLGTYAGMMTGLFAGVIVSLFLTSVQKTVGYERAKFIRRSGNIFPSLVWVRTSGRLK